MQEVQNFLKPKEIILCNPRGKTSRLQCFKRRDYNRPEKGSKKAMQSFLGKINFVRRFVPNFAHIVRPLHDLVKKDVVLTYTEVLKYAFKSIKKAIMEAPALMPPDFLKYFILYTFATDVSYVAMLTQKNEKDA